MQTLAVVSGVEGKVSGVVKHIDQKSSPVHALPQARDGPQCEDNHDDGRGKHADGGRDHVHVLQAVVGEEERVVLQGMAYSDTSNHAR